MDLPKLLIALGFVSIIIELIIGVATGFDLFVIGLILIIGGGIGAYTSTNVALVSVSVLSLVYVFFGRNFLKAKLTVLTKPSNSDALIGKTGTLLSSSSLSKPGQVKIDGEVWRCESNATLEKGTQVRVQSVSGVTVNVVSVS